MTASDNQFVTMLYETYTMALRVINQGKKELFNKECENNYGDDI